MNNVLLIGVLAALGMAQIGCVAHAQASGTLESDAPVVFAEPPTLVAVDSGVWVVEDSERATYYVDEHYWTYKDGAWYRSPSWDRGWTVVPFHFVPGVLSSRTHELYVHYRGAHALRQPAPKHAPKAALADARTPPAVGNPHGGPPGHDDIPGTGNQRKAAAEQPGHAMGGKKEDRTDENKD
jgi:hypothetical protein